MDYQRDAGQQVSKLLPTTTETSAQAGVFNVLTYYIKKAGSSVLNIFIAAVNGRRNGVSYIQGHLVVTKKRDSQTSFILRGGNLIVTSNPNEKYHLDANGHLICVTTERI